MSDNNQFKNPYLQGTMPQDGKMDYRQIMDEYRAKRSIQTGIPVDAPGQDDSERMLLPELSDSREPRTDNRFAFDMEQIKAQSVDLSDLRNIRKVNYGDTYRPAKSGTDIRRNYEGLAEMENVASEDVRYTINSARKRAAERKKSPVSSSAETIEQKRARIEAMLPTPEKQRELDKIVEQRGKIYSTPSFMRDELHLEDELTVNDTDIVTPLRTNLSMPGFSFRQRYMNQGLENDELNNISLAPVAPEGFGGGGGDMPEFESETSNWSMRSDEERFTDIKTGGSYELIPMGTVPKDKRQMFRAKVRLGGQKTANAFEAGAGSVKAAHSERLATELAAKKQRSRMRLSSLLPSGMKAPLPSRFTDLSGMDEQAENAARLAGIEAGKALARASKQKRTAETKLPPVPPKDRTFTAFADEEAVPVLNKPAQELPANASLAPTKNTFMDGNFEKPSGAKGIIKPQKALYTYLFDENADIPDNITDYQKSNYSRTGGEGSASQYGQYFLNDDDIDKQINDAENGIEPAAAVDYTEPVGISEPAPMARSLNSAVRDPINITSFGEEGEDFEAEEKTDSVRYKLVKGNINLNAMEGGGQPAPPLPDEVAELPGDVSNMPDAKIYAPGFSSLGGAEFEHTATATATAAAQIPIAAAASGFARSPIDFSSEQPEFDTASQFVPEDTAESSVSNVLRFTGGEKAEQRAKNKKYYEQQREALYVKLRDLFFTIGANAAVLILLLVFELLPQMGVNMPDVLTPSVPGVYYGLSGVMFVLSLIFFRHIIGKGFSDLTGGKASYKTFASVAAITTGVQLITAAIEAFSGHTAVRVYPAAFIFCLLVISAGEIFETTRMGLGLTFVSSDKERGTLLMADSSEGSHLIAEAAGMPSGSNVAYHAGTENLSGYFDFASEPDLSEQISSKLFWWVLVGGVAAGIAGWVSLKGFDGAATAMSVYFLLSMPFTAAASNNLPLSRLAKKLLHRGAMVSGWAAVDEFADVNVLTVDGSELFPHNSVELVGIKAFGDKRIDRAILDAAAVSIRVGGTLGDVFETVIRGETSVLSPVEELQYQEGLGISGLVKGRRILIGTRAMLERNGVQTPYRNYDEMYEKEGSKLVYLSSNGELSAMFVLKYHVNENTRERMRELADCGVNIAIKTSDVNINPKTVSRAFGIREEYISIIPYSISDKVENLITTVKKDAPAVLGTNRSLYALASALSSIVKIKSSLVLAVVLQTLSVAVGAVFALYMAFSGTGADFGPMQVILYCVIWGLAVLIVPNLKKIL